MGFRLALVLTLIVLGFSLVFKVQSSKATSTPIPKELRVLEIRYFPKGNDYVYHPDTLSAQLKTYLEDASKYHFYSNPAAPASITVNTVAVFNRMKARPSGQFWEPVYKKILQEDNICQKIHDLDVDQVWLWVDPRPGYDTGAGVEYAISSKLFQNGVQYATIANPALCNGRDSFVMMGFDFSRTADLALHSFGHYLEGLIGNLETIDLFWNRFAGDPATGFPRTERCGNVHYPPNARYEYDYASPNSVDTACEDWNPDGTGTKTAYNCSRWGCTHQGFLSWWMQNMPNDQSAIQYQNRTVPNWWDFTVDFDEAMNFYSANRATYFINNSFFDANLPR